MSFNHFSPDETLWYSQHHNYQSPMEQPHHHESQFPNHNKRLFFTQLDSRRAPEFEEIEPQLDSSMQLMLVEDRDSMFEKHLTPSDVGKLNRLVIPKQHAEKYFPLNNNNNSTNGVNSEVNGGNCEKGGLLLSFEDEAGKCWRFRYSYWNSSQSYVLTKGWSRYVKEKRLAAGDVVLFERHRLHMDRFFIGWRRRGTPLNSLPTSAGTNYSSGCDGWARMLCPGSAHPFPYQTDLCLHAVEGMEEKRRPVVNSKRLRLFGVNMEIDDDEHESTSEPQTPDGSSLSSQGQAHIQHSSSSYNYPDQSLNHTF